MTYSQLIVGGISKMPLQKLMSLWKLVYGGIFAWEKRKNMVLSAKLSGLLHIAAYLQHTNKKTCIFSDLLNMHENVSRLLYYIIFVVQNSLRWLSYEKIMLQLHAAAYVQHSGYFAAYSINSNCMHKKAWDLVYGCYLR